jgi:hypothetical protein
MARFVGMDTGKGYSIICCRLFVSAFFLLGWLASGDVASCGCRGGDHDAKIIPGPPTHQCLRRLGTDVSGHSIALVIGIALIAFALVLIPSSFDVFRVPATLEPKRGLSTLLVSLLPAGLLFLLIVFRLPIGALFRVLAIIAEFLGLGFYGWAWWSYRGRGQMTRDNDRLGKT